MFVILVYNIFQACVNAEEFHVPMPGQADRYTSAKTWGYFQKAGQADKAAAIFSKKMKKDIVRWMEKRYNGLVAIKTSKIVFFARNVWE